MLTSPHAWQPLIDERRTDDAGNIRYWTTAGDGDVAKRGIVKTRPRWVRWTYEGWKAEQSERLQAAIWRERERWWGVA